MGAFIALLAVAVLGVVFIGSILGIVAAVHLARVRSATEALLRETDKLGTALAALERKVEQQAAEAAIVLGEAEAAPARAEPEEAPSPTPPEPSPPPEPAVEEPPAPAAPEPAPPLGPAPEPAPPAAEPVPAQEPTPEPAAAPAPPSLVENLLGRMDQDWWAKVEDAVGKRWLTYLGGLLVFAAVGFIIKHAFDKEWITPSLVVAAGLLAGAAFVVAGDRFVRRGMRVFGLGLIGAPGLPLLYISLFAACQVYDIVPHWAAFGAMILATVAGMTLAVLHNSLAISFLSVLGGLLTPLLVSTGQDSRDALFGYLLILDLGVLGVAFLRKWRSLDILAFVGTAALFAGWYGKFYGSEAMVPTLLWLGAFYLTFLVLPFAHHLREGTPAPLERFVMALVIAAGAFGYAWAILHAEHRHALGLVALGMAACYVTLGSLTRRRVSGDARGVFAFIALAMMFLTIAVPLHLKLNGITLAWAVEGVVLLLLGYRFAYQPVRVGGLVVLAIAVVRLFARHWPLQAEAQALVLNPQFGVAVFVCLAAGAFALVHHRWDKEGGLSDWATKLAIAIGAGVLAEVVCHAEFGGWFARRAAEYGVSESYLSRSAGGVVWTLGSLAFLAASLRARSLAPRVTGIVSLGVAALLIASLYVLGLKPSDGYFANARFLVSLLVVAAAFLYAGGLHRWRQLCGEGEHQLVTPFGIAGGFALLVVLHVELARWLGTWGSYHARCGVTALWAVGAVGFLAAGLRLRSLASRGSGLVALGFGAVLAVLTYGAEPAVGPRYFANARFLVSLLVVAAAFLYAGGLHRWRQRCDEGEHQLVTLFGIAGGFALLVVLHVELARWLGTWGRYQALCGVTALWAVGAAGFLAAGLRLRSLTSRGSGLVALGIGAVLAVLTYGAEHSVGPHYFTNARFGAALLLVAMALAYGYLLRHQRKICEESEGGVGEALYTLAGVALLIVLSIELWDWLSEWGRYQARCGIAALWPVGAAAFLAAGVRWGAPVRRATGLVCLAVGAVLGGLLYEQGLLVDHAYFLNWRFAVATFIGAVALGHGLVLRRAPAVCGEDERTVGEALYVLAGLALLVVASIEVHGRLGEESRYLARCGLSAVWSAGAAAFVAAGVWRRSLGRRVTGLLVLGVAAMLATRAFAPGLVEHFFLFFNVRFATCLLVVAMVFGAAFALRRWPDRVREGERELGTGLYWLGMALLLMILSADAWLYSKAALSDAKEARWSAHMLLSFVWSTYAVTLLVIGFWKRLRPLRLTALGLFGLTALKLLVVDLGFLKGMYRILSFLVIGMLMIGASYLYHRIEKQLAEQRAQGDGTG